MEFCFLALIWGSCSLRESNLVIGYLVPPLFAAIYNLFVLLSLFFLGFRVWHLIRRCEDLVVLLAQCRKTSADSQSGFCCKGVDCDSCSSKFSSWKDCPCGNSNGNVEKAFMSSNWGNNSITRKEEKGLSDKFEGKEREEEVEEEDENWFYEDGEHDIMKLRKDIANERKLRAAAVMELEKERWAASSAADEALAKILQLQSEKGLIEREAHQYREIAEQKQMYDREVIGSLQWIILKLEAERRDVDAN